MTEITEFQKTILIVEDEQNIREILELALEDKYHTISTDDGMVALDLAYKHKPDLILLDVMLPSMEGYMVCKLLKNDQETSHIPIFMLTARVQKSDQFKGLRAGADEYILKPFDLNQLTQLIKNKLEEKS